MGQKAIHIEIVKLPTYQQLCVVILAVLLLCSCAGNSNHAPVTDLSEGAGSNYVVRPNDTLYAIAWRYGFDYRQLAKTNNISAPYKIVVGQTLLLKRSGQVTSATKSARNSTQKTNVNSRYSKNKTTAKMPTEAVKVADDSRDSSIAMKPFSGRWQWPANGPVVTRYTTAGTPHKGIDIGGKLGESVYAAAAGEVVYAGNGLVGYGNLLILRHDDEYLSAYGHNSKLLIREGDVVTAGQRIAEMGDSGTDSVKLHFEIRYDGKPVNPLGLLAQH